MYKIEDNKMYISNKDENIFSELCIGLKVFDTSFDISGIVEDCDDWHNVIVKYETDSYGTDSSGMYCLIRDCEDEGYNYFDNSLIINQ